jgi:L-Ala-D/L-Glu epimerase / N-acetyl-D-glutamate racemase
MSMSNTEKAVKDIRRKTRRKHSTEEKIRIVLEGPRGEDDALEAYQSPIMLCADESCLDTSELEQVVGRYQMVNIKLDKTGGLTEALNLARRAKEKGLTLMVGNMTGTSLAMAPAYVIAQLCDFVDLDGALFLGEDRSSPMSYERGVVTGLSPQLWG